MSSSDAPFKAAPGARLSPAAADPSLVGRRVPTAPGASEDVRNAPVLATSHGALGTPRPTCERATHLGKTPSRSAPAVLAICVVLGAIAGLVLFCFDPRQYHFYPVCFFHKATGLLCPGCGALRALHQLLHGHLATAFRFNPMLVVFLPFLFWFGARFARQTAGDQPLSLGLRPVWLWLILTAVLVVSVLRNLPGTPFALLRP
jgi:hypothetical protein